MNIDKNYALKYAKELTVIAMEHSMISPSEQPEETALDVAKFMETLYQELIKPETV